MELNTPIKVLDHGEIRLIDYMGNDQRVVDAARVSTQGTSKGPEQDKKLIEYLMEMRHTSPFEQVVFTFYVKMPIFVMRQWIRHRTARVSEISGRYSVLPEEFYIPEMDRIQGQGKMNKQGSEGEVTEEHKFLLLDNFQIDAEEAFADYKTALETCGVARELARTVLPLSTYTACYWQMDLHNLFHFLKLRLDPHAQYEIRVYAEAILKTIREIVPWSVEAWEKYQLNCVILNSDEVKELREFVKRKMTLDDVPSDGIYKKLGVGD